MEKVKIEPFKVIGIAVKTTNANGQGAKDIPALWHRLMTENVVARIPNKTDDTIYALYTDYEGDYTQPYTTIIGCRVESLDTIPEGMVGKSFEGGTFLKTTAHGDLSDDLVINEWIKIWNMDLDRAYTVDFEVFGERAQNRADAEVDILVAIK